jgi:hypothetical protein
MARCEDLTWWQKEVRKAEDEEIRRATEDPASRFDRLPAEVMELILFLLPSEDILSMTNAYKPVDAIVEKNSTLALHKKPAEHLLREAGKNEEVSKLVRGSKNLLKKLNMKKTLCRQVPDIDYAVRTICHITEVCFQFDRNLTQNGVSLLLEVAAQVEVGWQDRGSSYMILVQAGNMTEAHSFLSALKANNYNAHLSWGWISRQQWMEFYQKRAKFFLIVLKIGANFNITTFPALINFKAPNDVHDHLELHSLNPEKIYNFFYTSQQSDFAVAADIIDHLKPHCKKPNRRDPDPRKKLIVNRSFYIARSKYNAQPVARVFNTPGI